MSHSQTPTVSRRIVPPWLPVSTVSRNLVVTSPPQLMPPRCQPSSVALPEQPSKTANKQNQPGLSISGNSWGWLGLGLAAAAWISLLTLSLIVTLTTSLAAALTSSIAYFKCCRGQASNVRAVCFGLAFAISATVASLTIFLSLWHSQPSTPWQWLVLRG